jgi:hypothetical protein
VIENPPDLHALGNEGNQAHLSTALGAQQLKKPRKYGRSALPTSSAPVNVWVVAKRLADIGLGRVVVALAVELATRQTAATATGLVCQRLKEGWTLPLPPQALALV